MIELQNVTLTFPDGDGRVTAVDDVTLRGANASASSFSSRICSRR